MPDDSILHQDDVEDVISDKIETAEAADDLEEADTYAIKTGNVIAAPTAPGATYDQTEMASLKTAIDAIRTTLIESGVTDAS